VKQSETDEAPPAQDLGAGSHAAPQEEMTTVAAGHISGIGQATPAKAAP
jgi:hypothetical protein